MQVRGQVLAELVWIYQLLLGMSYYFVSILARVWLEIGEGAAYIPLKLSHAIRSESGSGEMREGSK